MKLAFLSAACAAALLAPAALAGPPVWTPPASATPAPAAPAAAPAAADAPSTSDAKPADAKPADAKPDEAREDAAPAPAATVGDAPADAAKADVKARVVAVLDLKVGGDAKPLANALAAVVAAGVSSRPGLKAVSRNELKSLLAHQADASLLGCESINCMSDIAKLADANLVVSGSLDKITGGDAGPGGVAYALALTLIDPSVPAILQRAETTWRGNPEEMVTVIPPMLDRLFDGAAAASYKGALEVFAPAGASLTVDGKAAGTAPLKTAVRDLPIGVHRLGVSEDGYIAKTVDVVVARGETTVTRVALDEEPYYSQWWFWTAVGGGAAVVVAAGSTVGVVLALGNKEPPPTTLVVKTPLPTASAATP